MTIIGEITGFGEAFEGNVAGNGGSEEPVCKRVRLTCRHGACAELRDLLLVHAGGQRRGEAADLSVQPDDLPLIHACLSAATPAQTQK